MPTAEQFTDPVAHHGEGPVWSETWGGLRWVDMLAGDVLSLVGNEIERWHVGDVAAAIRPRRGGGVLVATDREFLLADEVGGPLHVVAEAFRDSALRFNDGTCDPAGNFLCGTMAYDETPEAGSLFRLTPDAQVQTVLAGVTISNGMCWSPDGSMAYYADTATGRVDVFDSDDSGRLLRRRPFVTIDTQSGSPDGLTVDAEGGVWVALWGGGAVHHFDSTGRLVDVLEVPVRNVTACAFGGPALTDLYITTSREADDPPPLAAGAVFRCADAGSGTPVRVFGG
jgi:sugar lactone lactonase YvrE